MANRDDELYKRTYKGQADSTSQRVYYTLHDPMMKDPPQPIPVGWTRDDRSQAHRTARVLSDLIEHLEKKGLLTEAELDEILLLATG
jgi:hypothetical protein